MTFVERIAGVFRMSGDTFEEIEADKGATVQAAVVVLVVALLAGIAAYVNTSGTINASSLTEAVGGFDITTVASGITPVGSFVHEFVGTFVAWFIWALFTFLIGGKLFGGDTNMSEMLRVTGFAQAPRLLSAFAFIPCLGFILAVAGWMMSLIAMVIAIQRGSDLDGFKSFGAVLLSFATVMIVHFFVLPPITRAIFGA